MLGAMTGSPRAALLAMARTRAAALSSSLHRLGSGLRRLAAPQCAVCRVEHGDPVCAGCLQDFFDASLARCAVCAGRLPALPELLATLRCGRCLAAPPDFDRTIALGDYAPPLDGMVIALKFGGRLDL